MIYTGSARREGQLMRHYVSQLANGFEWKMALTIFGTVIASLQGFYTNMLWGFLALFIIDLATGIMKSFKNGIPITSYRLRDSVVKLGGYMFLITALTITSFYQPNMTPVITGTYYYFMFTELKSILENVKEMGVRVPAFVSSLVNLRISFFEKSKEDSKDNKGDTDNG